MRLLITGGAGYIGSVVGAQFAARGAELTVLDNLSTGYRENLPDCNFIEGDIRDQALLERVFSESKFDAVLHFAAKISVEESIENPDEYFSVNRDGGMALLQACEKAGVRKLVFSSTAAVYGQASANGEVREDLTAAPLNPYGRSKLELEEAIEKSGLVYVILRYFNVIGASLDLLRGPRGENPSSLPRRVAQLAAGKDGELVIHGDDYPTTDGTPVRDFIHVEDLASAHVKAIDYLMDDGRSGIFNCGYGHGTSVRELIDAFKKVSEHDFKVRVGPRRPTDIVQSIARTEKIRELLGWSPKHDHLEKIVTNAKKWEEKLLG